jgi:hypothetical protein
MMRVCVVCEGQTEEEFVVHVLAPSFYGLGINLVPEMIETSPGLKGGALRYERVKRRLRNTLRQNSQPVVTTIFDLYRLDNDFPGVAVASRQHELAARLKILNRALHADIVAHAGCRSDRFIPYIQPTNLKHFFFSDVATLSGYQPGWQNALLPLSRVRAIAASPEHINEQPETKPAKHLQRELKNPSYHKPRHGPMIAQKIGLNKIETECAYFAGWLKQIRALTKSDN